MNNSIAFPVHRSDMPLEAGQIRISGIQRSRLANLINAMHTCEVAFHAGKLVRIQICADPSGDDRLCSILACGQGVLGYLVEEDMIEASPDVIATMAGLSCEIGDIVVIEGRHQVDDSRALITSMQISVEDGDIYVAHEQRHVSTITA